MQYAMHGVSGSGDLLDLYHFSLVPPSPSNTSRRSRRHLDLIRKNHWVEHQPHSRVEHQMLGDLQGSNEVSAT